MRPNLYDYLKILALVAMIIDHVGFFLYPELEVLRVIGRLAFPLFLFLVGWNHSYRQRKELWIFGIVLQGLLLIAVWMGETELLRYANILITIGLTRMFLGWIDRQEDSRALQGMMCLLAIVFAPYTQSIVEYGTLNIVFGLLGYRVRIRGFGFRTMIGAGAFVLYHLLFMKDYRGFSTIFDWWLVGVGVLLFLAIVGLSVRNRSLLLTEKIDSFALGISKNTLSIYVLHIIVLVIVRYTIIPQL